MSKHDLCFHLSPFVNFTGKDNYPADIKDDGEDFEAPVKNFDGTQKNVGYYHRYFDTGLRDAMGNTMVHRGFGDDYLFVAATKQKKVANNTLTRCSKKRRNKPSVCKEYHQKWSYAIPLEVIYLTPLSKWNPYDIAYHGTHGYPDRARTIINKDKRNGKCTEDHRRALNGTSSQVYYRTPVEFFDASFVDRNPADTGKLFLCVLDKNGKSRKVRSSGTRVMLPNIPEVGIIRQRYPVMPIHGEGSSVWKELNALRDFVMFSKQTKYLDWNTKSKQLHITEFETTNSRSNAAKRRHKHKVS